MEELKLLKPKEAPKTALQVKTKEEFQQDLQDAMERAKARITARKLSEAASKMRAQAEEQAAKDAKKIQGVDTDVESIQEQQKRNKEAIENLAPWAKEVDLEQRAREAKRKEEVKATAKRELQEKAEAMARLYPNLEGKTPEEIGTALSTPPLCCLPLATVPRPPPCGLCLWSRTVPL